MARKRPPCFSDQGTHSGEGGNLDVGERRMGGRRKEGDEEDKEKEKKILQGISKTFFQGCI